MAFRTLSPWDALRWFRPPLETLFTNPTIGTKIAGYDPQRVVLVFCSASINTAFSLSLKVQVAGTPTGLSVSPNQQPLILTHADHGPLVQQAWYLAATVTGNVTVIELFLNDWPVEEGDLAPTTPDVATQ